MEIVLHIGAHRTGTTGFQNYMRRNATTLSARGIGFWGPGRTRRPWFASVYAPLNSAFDPKPCGHRRDDRLRRQIEKAEGRGIGTLIISDENMMGSIRQNIRHGQLYPGVGERLACVIDAFGGRIRRLLVSPRSLEHYWCSSLSYGVGRGIPVPTRDKLSSIGHGRRGWREVITEVSRSVPSVDIRVLPFETYQGRPDAFLAAGADVAAPVNRDQTPVNAAPTLPELRRVLLAHGQAASVLPFGMGRWNPFTNEEHSALREVYADDMMWLTAGADGLARLTEDRARSRAGNNPLAGAKRKGHFDEFEERQMARPG
jgi:hypothetical protein